MSLQYDTKMDTSLVYAKTLTCVSPGTPILCRVGHHALSLSRWRRGSNAKVGATADNPDEPTVTAQKWTFAFVLTRVRRKCVYNVPTIMGQRFVSIICPKRIVILIVGNVYVNVITMGQSFTFHFYIWLVVIEMCIVNVPTIMGLQTKI